MSRQIRVSDRAWALISGAGAFGESTSDVVDRLLGIGTELPSSKPEHPAVDRMGSGSGDYARGPHGAEATPSQDAGHPTPSAQSNESPSG